MFSAILSVYSISVREEQRVAASEHHRYAIHSHGFVFETVSYDDITARIVESFQMTT